MSCLSNINDPASSFCIRKVSMETAMAFLPRQSAEVNGVV